MDKIKNKYQIAFIIWKIILLIIITSKFFSNYSKIHYNYQNIVSTVNSNGQIINLNKSWKFKFQNDNEWQQINIPHDFSIIQKFDEKYEAASAFLPGGIAIYKKEFKIFYDKPKTVILYFYGVYKDAFIKINNKYIGENHYGYNSFAFDISNYLISNGKTVNQIEVKVEHELYSSRWYSGSGISRGIFMKISDLLHIEIDNVRITTPDINKKKGTVNIEIVIINDYNISYEFQVNINIKNKKNEKVAYLTSKKYEIIPKNKLLIKEILNVDNPLLWNDKNPNLYIMEIELINNNKEILDKYSHKFGFRYYHFDKNKGFIINGKPTKLHGACLHHDYGALGNIDNYDAAYKRLTKLKEMGINALRTSHNTPYKTWIDISDEIGLYVIDEFFDGWNFPKRGNLNDFSKYFNVKINKNNKIIDGNVNLTWAEFVIITTIKRDRNSPSVIMWSIGNEIACAAKIDEKSINIAKKLIFMVKKYDNSRIITRADNDFRQNISAQNLINDEIIKNKGIIGYNYGKIKELKNGLSKYGNIYLSESACVLNSRGVYSIYKNAFTKKENDGKLHLTSYDISHTRWGTPTKYSLYITLTQDYMAGQFIWTGFDYLGEPTPWDSKIPGSVSGKGPIPNTAFKGVYDTAGFPKDSYYLYRAMLRDDNIVLHILNAWDKNNICFIDKNKKTPVHIYSNVYKIEIYRNDIDEFICTSIRKDHITKEGYKYFTYERKSNNKICDVVYNDKEDLGSDLISRFNIEFKEYTKLYTKAYYKNGTMINDVKIIGNHFVQAPNLKNLQLDVSVDKNKIKANGESLAYIEVSIIDDEGIFNTMGENEIVFYLEGKGKILGVDNGDESTVDKFQQKSVLKSNNLAMIKAYRGKALAIISSTFKPGKITVIVSSEGLGDKLVEIESL